jgi:hypothetical protein
MLILHSPMAIICTTCFSNQLLFILPTEYIHVFHMILKMNSGFSLNSINQLTVVIEKSCFLLDKN